MDKDIVKKALADVRTNSPKRKFKQSFDMVVNLKDIDLKKTENQVDFYTTLHFGIGKKIKVCGLVGPELHEESKGSLDHTIPVQNFDQFDKKKAKKLANEYDYFVAQANIMPKVAGAFGRVLGPMNKMPNPKAGCVVPPKSNLKPLQEKLQKTVRVKAKTSPIIQIMVGGEEQTETEVIDNIMTAYDQIIHHLPQEKNNIKSIYLKLTMGKPVKVF